MIGKCFKLQNILLYNMCVCSVPIYIFFICFFLLQRFHTSSAGNRLDREYKNDIIHYTLAEFFFFFFPFLSFRRCCVQRIDVSGLWVCVVWVLIPIYCIYIATGQTAALSIITRRGSIIIIYIYLGRYSVF